MNTHKQIQTQNMNDMNATQTFTNAIAPGTLEPEDMMPPTIGELLPPTKKLGELKSDPSDKSNWLLGNRFLCRGGGLLMAGSTGIGKSSLLMQSLILWANGKAALQIEPARKLRSLVIQAENDEEDLAEMRDGVIAGSGLSPEEIAVAHESVLIANESSRTGADFADSVLAPLLEEHRPDLVVIDPALAYLGGDSGKQEDVGTFLRNELNPLIQKHGCGAIIIHHTNKPSNASSPNSSIATNLAYAGSGSAEWANWSRAVLAALPAPRTGTFILVAAKRGNRVGWMEMDGKTPSIQRFIAHSAEPRQICWRVCNEFEVADLLNSNGKPPKKPVDILPHVPTEQDSSIAKNALIQKCQQAGIGVNATRGLIDQLIEDGELHEWRVKRPAAPPERRISRFPQTLESSATDQD